MSNIDTGLKVLETGTKILGGGGGVPQQMPAGGGQQVFIQTGDNPTAMLPGAGGYIPQQMAMPVGYDPMMATYGGQSLPMMAPTGYTGGGGGGFGPPGSEFVMDEATGQMVPVEGMSMGMKIGIALGIGAVVYFVVIKK